MSYQDKGLEANAVDLTGVPSGRYLAEWGALLEPTIESEGRDVFGQVIAVVADFFREASTGRQIVISAAPASPIVLADLAYLALSDVNRLGEKIRVKKSVTD